MALGRVDSDSRSGSPEGCRTSDTGPTETKAVSTEVIDHFVRRARANVGGGIDLVGTGQVPELQELVTSRLVGFKPGHPDGRLDFETFLGLATSTKAPARAVVLALVFAIEDKGIDFGLVGDIELDRTEATDEVRTKVPDERGCVVRLAH